jgi:tRNA (mo5U34)-methyltransferase
VGAVSDSDVGSRTPAAAVAGVRRWYHCIEVAPGIVTPGLFDLRPIVDRLPWPDVRGKRCLDVGTSDGFLAFELERRGAAEVLAIDIDTHEAWDWEVHVDELGPQYLRAVSGPGMGAGFRTARALRRSAVAFRALSVYELAPDSVGEFDVVVCGSLLLHLRDPLGALAAIRSVCRGQLLCTNQIDLGRSIGRRRAPLVRLDGTSGITQWWVPNAAGHEQMVRAAGFAIERRSRLYSIPFGPAHPPRARRPQSRLRGIAERLATGNEGVPHLALLSRPRA